MIKEFVEVWDNKKDDIRNMFIEKHPKRYLDVVHNIVKVINENIESYDKIDPTRIHEINDGGHQGTLVYIIASDQYQPNKYWIVSVDYGSCSGCDTLDRIRNYEDGKPSDSQIEDYMTLSLHIIQKIKKIDL